MIMRFVEEFFLGRVIIRLSWYHDLNGKTENGHRKALWESSVLINLVMWKSESAVTEWFCKVGEGITFAV